MRSTVVSLLRGVLLSGVLLASLGCGDTAGPVSPAGPSRPSPADNSEDVFPVLTLHWSAVDRPGDSLFFRLYFGNTNPPPLIEPALTDTFYSGGAVATGATYYWKVGAYTHKGYASTSPVWRFTTDTAMVFPIALGNTWEYGRLYFVSAVEPDSLPLPHPDTLRGSSVTEIDSVLSLPGSIKAYRFRTDWVEESLGSGQTLVYRNQDPRGLFSYAFASPGWAGPPKMPPGGERRIHFKGLEFLSIEELLATLTPDAWTTTRAAADTLVYEEPPRRELAYPLNPGQRWVYRDRGAGDAFDMERGIVGTEQVLTAAGTFDCYKIRWYWDIDGDQEWDTDLDGYDYLSAAGYVKREFFIYDIWLSDEFGDSIGTYDVTDRFELTNYDLAE